MDEIFNARSPEITCATGTTLYLNPDRSSISGYWYCCQCGRGYRGLPPTGLICLDCIIPPARVRMRTIKMKEG
ncbi:hypothetical protein LCGC14_0817570 [marine sediment metagenome]|uniref:Uncharacterized protein n=1 Tax=marine sediment metagenome TaxID=412755 RepID=A0A0F9S4R2_9ZZZZ